jgi:hypothetical protein
MIFYRTSEASIDIARVLHQSRDLSVLLARDPTVTRGG